MDRGVMRGEKRSGGDRQYMRRHMPECGRIAPPTW